MRFAASVAPIAVKHRAVEPVSKIKILSVYVCNFTYTHVQRFVFYANIRAATLAFGFSFKVETYNALSLLTFDKFAGTRKLFSGMRTA
jgi:hypothetical protein